MSALFFILICGFASAQAPSVTLHHRDAEVWSQVQRIEGAVTGTQAERGVLNVNGVTIPFNITRSRFAVPIKLTEPKSVIVAQVSNGGEQLASQPLKLTLGFTPRPEVYAYATHTNRVVTLRWTLLNKPFPERLEFRWEQDPDNPTELKVLQGDGSGYPLGVPISVPAGEYYFTLHVSSGTDSWRARTYVRVSKNGVGPFDIERDHAGWIDQAVVYGVTPYAFVPGGGFKHITEKVPELAALGVTALWLQPVFESFAGGQGYDIINYFGVRTDYGTAAELRKLVTTAHAHGLRVLLDFVPNHSSIMHPYARDAIKYGQRSHYFDFYQRRSDDARYAMHYHERRAEMMDFIYYFWPDFPNLNYHNPEVQRWMIEAGRYWIEQFDIDGYRIDAVWGVNARNPQFMRRWRLALKRIKPEILLPGEDKASLEATFEGRFDAAYDWTRGEAWVSQWSWQTDYTPDYSQNPTIFNHPDESARAALLEGALKGDERNASTRGLTLRFMENNDTPRFLPTHQPAGIARTKMVAALIFTLPGIPLVFNGQEVGFQTHPYETPYIFLPHQNIASQDRLGLLPFYRRMIALRGRYPALTSSNFRLLSVPTTSGIVAYHRWLNDEHVVVITNLTSNSRAGEIELPSGTTAQATALREMTDLISERLVSTQIRDGKLLVEIGAYSTFVFELN